MKLLDEPIHKEAAMSNKQAIARMLVGTGLGAGAGALGEYLVTGDLGWKGGVLGALLGTGASAALNPEARKQLLSNLKKKPDAADDAPVTEQAPSEEPSNEEIYNKFKAMLASGDEYTPEDTAMMQQFIAAHDQYKAEREWYAKGVATETKLRKDPNYAKVFEETRADKGSEDISNIVGQYATVYTQETGKAPTPEHLVRFSRLTRSGELMPQEWGSYMRDEHELSGAEEYPLELAAGQMGGGYTLDKLSKPAIKKMMSTPQGRAQLRKILGSKTGYNKLLFGKGGAKMAGRAVPGLNLAFDVPEFFLDPNTGEYTWNVGKNISEQDRLMELREKHELMPTGDKRNLHYNIYAGGLRGWVNPLTSIAIAGNRLKDVNMEGYKNLQNRGFLEGAKSNMQSGAATVAQTAADFWLPVVDLVSKRKIKDPKFKWGQDVKAPTPQELKALRDRIANQRGYYEEDGKRIPIQEYHKKEGEAQMDSIELVRRMIRKEAAMGKEAGRLDWLKPALKRYHAGQPAIPAADAAAWAKSLNIPTKTTTTVTDPSRFQRLKDWASNVKLKDPIVDKKYRVPIYGGTTAVGGALAGANYALRDPDDEGVKVPAPTGAELDKARTEAGKPKAEAIQSALSPEVLAGAGGAAAGGAAGYALAPTLGVDKITGAVGGGALTAIAAAILANRLKEQPAS
jgi:hypothetical protein